MLKEELPEIFKFFELDEKEKAENFTSTLENSLKFADKIKEQFINGSEEDKKEILGVIEDMKDKIAEQIGKLCSELGISEKELSAFMDNPNNFSKEEWEAMQGAKGYIEKMNSGFSPFSKQKDKKRKLSKTHWIQS